MKRLIIIVLVLVLLTSCNDIKANVKKGNENERLEFSESIIYKDSFSCCIVKDNKTGREYLILSNGTAIIELKEEIKNAN